MNCMIALTNEDSAHKKTEIQTQTPKPTTRTTTTSNKKTKRILYPAKLFKPSIHYSANRVFITQQNHKKRKTKSEL